MTSWSTPRGGIQPRMVDERNMLLRSPPRGGIGPWMVEDRNMLPQSSPRGGIGPWMVEDRNMLSQSSPRGVIGPWMVEDRNMLPQSSPRGVIGPWVVEDRNMLPQSLPRGGIGPWMVEDRNMLPQSSPSGGIGPWMVEDRNMLSQSLPRGGIGPWMVEDRNIYLPPQSKPRGRMATVMTENRVILPQVLPFMPTWPNSYQYRLKFVQCFEQIQRAAVKNLSIIKSMEVNSLSVSGVNDALLVAFHQRCLSSMLYPYGSLGITQNLQAEFLTLLSLDVMFSLHIPKEALRPKPIIWNFKEQKEMNPKEIVEIFWITGLPKTERPRLGVAICIIDGDIMPKKFVSDFGIGTHAESTMIDYLKRVLISERLKGTTNPSKIVHIEVFQNYSPCGECSKKYCRLLGEFANLGLCVKFKIHFVALYRIYWEIAKPRPTLDWLPLDVHCMNRDGLLDLMKGGIDMSTFTVCTWMRLLDMLGLHVDQAVIRTYITCGRNNVDSKTAKTFNRLLEYGSRRSDFNDRLSQLRLSGQKKI